VGPVERPESRYARLGRAHIAYQRFGRGPDLLFMLGLTTHTELMWEEPRLARFLGRLGSFSRTLVFDKRGSGLSDAADAATTLEVFVDDAMAVLDDAASDDVVVVAANEAALVALPLVAAHQDRIRGLVVVNGTAKVMQSEDYPIGVDWRLGRRQREEFDDAYEDRPMGLQLIAPSMAGDAAFDEWSRRYQRLAASPGSLQQTVRLLTATDVRSVLPIIERPTLVLHRRDDLFLTVEHGQFLADEIAGARFVELDGADHLVWVGPDTERMLDEIERFVTGSDPGESVDRRLATVLFTDIVGSTEHLVRLGDRKWAELVATHDATAGRIVSGLGGRVVDTAGDGVFAVFDGPSRAIEAAQRIQRDLALLGLSVRAGVHTGEVEIGPGSVRGLAVHLGARIMSCSDGTNVLASRTVRDLTVGSPYVYQPMGVRSLKGIPDGVELFAVEDAARH
jgi:class 3 adenylate cyclase